LLFPPEAVTRIFDHAKGNPSRTMRLCRRAIALAADDCGPVSVAEIDAAAQIELTPQPTFKRKVVPRRTFGLARLSGLPAAPGMLFHVRRDGLDEKSAASKPSGCSSPAFGERKAFRRRVVDFASAITGMTTVLAVGWFYIAQRDTTVHPIAAFEATISAGVTAAIARVQPGEDQGAMDLPAEVGRPVDVPGNASLRVSPRKVQTSRLRDLNEVVASDVSATGDQQPPFATGREPVAELEPPEAEGKAAPTIEDLLNRGNRLLELGDVAAARLFYGMAAEQGSAEGALLMGLTFDPAYFERKGIYGTRPHVFEAAEWYEKAAALGSLEAEERRNALELRLRSAAQAGDEDARHALKLLFDTPLQ
jgi:hypothetical protein